MESTKVAIVIPAYNEEKTIKAVLAELDNELANIDVCYVVVNDFSQDRTSLCAQEAGAYVIDLPFNHGYAKAIEAGFEFVINETDCKYIATVDADGQHHPHSVGAIINATIAHQADISIGIRDHFARLGERFYGLYYQRKFGVEDPLCGLKVYKVDFYKEINSFETFDSIGTELALNYLLNKKKLYCEPIIIRERLDEARFGSGLKVNIRLLKSLYATEKFIKGYSLLAK